LTTTREITPTGLGRKSDIELGDRDRAQKGLRSGRKEIVEVRSRWAAIANEYLQAHGVAARIDHRSFKEQGLEREPTTHLGVAVSGMERRGIETEVGQRIRAEQAQETQVRLERAAELGRLEREGRELAKSILVLDVNIAAARAVRDQHPPQQLLDQIKAQGREVLKGWGQELKREQETHKERQKALEKQRELDRTIGRSKDRSRDGPDYSR